MRIIFAAKNARSLAPYRAPGESLSEIAVVTRATSHPGANISVTAGIITADQMQTAVPQQSGRSAEIAARIASRTRQRRGESRRRLSPKEGRSGNTCAASIPSEPQVRGSGAVRRIDRASRHAPRQNPVSSGRRSGSSPSSRQAYQSSACHSASHSARCPTGTSQALPRRMARWRDGSVKNRQKAHAFWVSVSGDQFGE